MASASALSPTAPFPLHACVRLVAALTHDGIRFPPEALGTIVAVHGQGAAYEVEFTSPAWAVVTLPQAMLHG